MTAVTGSTNNTRHAHTNATARHTSRSLHGVARTALRLSMEVRRKGYVILQLSNQLLVSLGIALLILHAINVRTQINNDHYCTQTVRRSLSRQ